MVTELATKTAVQATREELLSDFGEEYLSIQSLFRFCFVPGGRLSFLKELAPEEEWGSNNFVLLKYLAVHVRLAIEQGRYVWNGDQIVLTAGRLSTAPAFGSRTPNTSVPIRACVMAPAHMVQGSMVT